MDIFYLGSYSVSKFEGFDDIADTRLCRIFFEIQIYVSTDSYFQTCVFLQLTDIFMCNPGEAMNVMPCQSRAT